MKKKPHEKEQYQPEELWVPRGALGDGSKQGADMHTLHSAEPNGMSPKSE